MKISLVTETFPPEINGVAMTLEKLALGLASLGHGVQVIRPRQRAATARLRTEFEEVEVAGLPLPGYDGLNMGLPVIDRIDRLWRESRPDVVYLATEGPLGLAALLAARARGVRPVSGFHTNFHQYMRHYRLQWLEVPAMGYLRALHNATCRTFAPSADVLEALRAAGFRNLRLLGRGVDTALFDPAGRSARLRAEWGAGEDAPVFLFVGRIASEKNMDLLFRAWDRIRARRPDARLVLVGDGPERAALREAHPGARFVGSRTGADLAAHYASGDFFLFPSVTETFGNVVTEALASGLVVLAFDYAAPRKFIRHGENGFVAPFGDEGAFLRIAESLAAPGRCFAAVRAAARETGLGLSWESVLRRFADDIGEVLAQRAGESLAQA
ncbi:MAG: glycosyltransferase family 4 protein [Puniceicoccaceae bacterium]